MINHGVHRVHGVRQKVLQQNEKAFPVPSVYSVVQIVLGGLS